MKITHLGPKRCQTRRLGPFLSSLPSLSHIPPLETICVIISVVSIKNKRRKHKNHSPRAQTTPDASFGPIFVIPALLVTYFIISTYTYIQTLVSIKNNQWIHENCSPRAQTIRLVSFGPVFVTSALTLRSWRVSSSALVSPAPSHCRCRGQAAAVSHGCCCCQSRLWWLSFKAVGHDRDIVDMCLCLVRQLKF